MEKCFYRMILFFAAASESDSPCLKISAMFSNDWSQEKIEEILFK